MIFFSRNIHKRFFFLIFFFAIFLQNINAQYTVEWTQTFGGDGWDEANSCLETRTGDYMVAGFARQQDQHMFAVKMYKDSRGRWGKTFTDFFASSANSIVQTFDGYVVIAGYSVKKREFQSDLLVMKTDTSGNILWMKNFGKDGDEQGLKIIECKDHGYAIAGFSTSNYDVEPNWYILKLDQDGNLLWDKDYGGSGDDKATGIAETYDNGLVITGYFGTQGGGRKTMSLLKLDQYGNDEWTQMYDINNWSQGSSVIASMDSMIYVAGSTRMSPILDYDALLVKCNMSGDTIWTRTIGDENWQEATGLIETYDEAFVMCGFSMSNTKDQSGFMAVKYDSRGNLLWNYTFKRRSQDYAKCLIETRDNGLLLSGTTYSFGKGWDMAVLKMQNVDRSDMYFDSPRDSISAVLTDTLNFRVCLKSFGVPSSVRIIVNGTEQYSQSEFKKQDRYSSSCEYAVGHLVKLSPGRNEVVFIVKDYKNFEFIKKRIIYLLPKYQFIR